MVRDYGRYVLIIDDEPEFLQWVIDFFDSRIFGIDIATNLESGIAKALEKKYVFILVDMNIPAKDESMESESNPIIKKYPGLKAIIKLRNSGYMNYQMTAYTVHDDEGLEGELDKLSCKYVLKGRPSVLKYYLNKNIKEWEKAKRRKKG